MSVFSQNMGPNIASQSSLRLLNGCNAITSYFQFKMQTETKSIRLNAPQTIYFCFNGMVQQVYTKLLSPKFCVNFSDKVISFSASF